MQDDANLVILQGLALASCSEGDGATQHADKGIVGRARATRVLRILKQRANFIERPK